jgi:YHS domain-containing protein
MKRYSKLLTISIAATGTSLLAAEANLSASRTSNSTNLEKGIVDLLEEAAKTAHKAKVNIDRQGVILKGYDPVAYFTLHRAVQGNASFQTRFGGATYEFASAADKAAFDKNPSRYVPQYGAFCAN